MDQYWSLPPGLGAADEDLPKPVHGGSDLDMLWLLQGLPIQPNPDLPMQWFQPNCDVPTQWLQPAASVNQSDMCHLNISPAYLAGLQSQQQQGANDSHQPGSHSARELPCQPVEARQLGAACDRPSLGAACDRPSLAESGKPTTWCWPPLAGSGATGDNSVVSMSQPPNGYLQGFQELRTRAVFESVTRSSGTAAGQLDAVDGMIVGLQQSLFIAPEEASGAPTQPWPDRDPMSEPACLLHRSSEPASLMQRPLLQPDGTAGGWPTNQPAAGQPGREQDLGQAWPLLQMPGGPGPMLGLHSGRLSSTTGSEISGRLRPVNASGQNAAAAATHPPLDGLHSHDYSGRSSLLGVLSGPLKRHHVPSEGGVTPDHTPLVESGPAKRAAFANRTGSTSLSLPPQPEPAVSQAGLARHAGEQPTPMHPGWAALMDPPSAPCQSTGVASPVPVATMQASGSGIPHQPEADPQPRLAASCSPGATTHTFSRAAGLGQSQPAAGAHLRGFGLSSKLRASRLASGVGFQRASSGDCGEAALDRYMMDLQPYPSSGSTGPWAADYRPSLPEPRLLGTVQSLPAPASNQQPGRRGFIGGHRLAGREAVMRSHLVPSTCHTSATLHMLGSIHEVGHDEASGMYASSGNSHVEDSGPCAATAHASLSQSQACNSSSIPPIVVSLAPASPSDIHMALYGVAAGMPSDRCGVVGGFEGSCPASGPTSNFTFSCLGTVSPGADTQGGSQRSVKQPRQSWPGEISCAGPTVLHPPSPSSHRIDGLMRGHSLPIDARGCIELTGLPGRHMQPQTTGEPGGPQGQKAWAQRGAPSQLGRLPDSMSQWPGGGTSPTSGVKAEQLPQTGGANRHGAQAGPHVTMAALGGMGFCSSPARYPLSAVEDSGCLAGGFSLMRLLETDPGAVHPPPTSLQQPQLSSAQHMCRPLQQQQQQGKRGLLPSSTSAPLPPQVMDGCWSMAWPASHNGTHATDQVDCAFMSRHDTAQGTTQPFMRGLGGLSVPIQPQGGQGAMQPSMHQEAGPMAWADPHEGVGPMGWLDEPSNPPGWADAQGPGARMIDLHTQACDTKWPHMPVGGLFRGVKDAAAWRESTLSTEGTTCFSSQAGHDMSTLGPSQPSGGVGGHGGQHSTAQQPCCGDAGLDAGENLGELSERLLKLVFAPGQGGEEDDSYPDMVPISSLLEDHHDYDHLMVLSADDPVGNPVSAVVAGPSTLSRSPNPNSVTFAPSPTALHLTPGLNGLSGAPVIPPAACDDPETQLDEQLLELLA